MPLFLLGVRKKGDKDLELVIYAKESEPLQVVPLKKLDQMQDLPVQMEWSRGDKDSDKLTVNILGKSEVVLRIAQNGEIIQRADLSRSAIQRIRSGTGSNGRRRTSRRSGWRCITRIRCEGRIEINFSPGPTPSSVRAADGTILAAPVGWVLLPPGDPGLTRRVKAAGDHWTVQEKRGRKIFFRGVWAPSATIERIRVELDAERATEGYVKRKEADARRRDRAQAEYVGDFLGAVVTFLAFHANYADLAEWLARAVTEHATPVGSGTVAQTKRIPVEQRAEAAVIAWIRHHTTAYEGMVSLTGSQRQATLLYLPRSRAIIRPPVGVVFVILNAPAGARVTGAWQLAAYHYAPALAWIATVIAGVFLE